MPAVAISAVNTGTDTLTAVAHGLLTGDRCRVRNVGGALPTGLTGAVDVFAIRVDVDNLKLATSNANALAGTPVIDITGAGSGANTVEYSLPYCIPRIMAPGVQLFSADLNADWNALVALYDLLTGQAQSVYTNMPATTRFVPKFWASGGGTDTATPVLDPGGNVAPVWKLNTTTTILGSLITPLDYKPGDKLASFSLDIYGDGVTNTTYDLIVDYYPTPGTALGSVVQIAHVSGIGHTAAWSTQTFTIDAPNQVLADGGVLFLWVKINGNSTSGPHFCYVGDISQKMITP